MASVIDPSADVKLAELDSRNRISLNSINGTLSKRYIITEHDDGTITLEPATVLTAFERAYLDSQARSIVEHERANPQNRRKWTPHHNAAKRV